MLRNEACIEEFCVDSLDTTKNGPSKVWVTSWVEQTARGTLRVNGEAEEPVFNIADELRGLTELVESFSTGREESTRTWSVHNLKAV